MFLLDTNVIFEMRKVGDGRADSHLIAWLSEIDTSLFYLSSITVMELEIGILRLERRDKRQGAMLRSWLDKLVLPEFENRIFPIDTAVARCCARLHIPDPRSERDALIAATAITHGMTVVTRNVADFRATGAPLLNPWEFDGEF